MKFPKSSILSPHFRPSLLALGVSLTLASQAMAVDLPHPNQKPASTFTQALNAKVLSDLPFANKDDFADANRGFIAKPEKLTIVRKGQNGANLPVWDLEKYKEYITVDAPASATPPSINPSLYRNAQLNMIYGLFEVTPGIYQVRGYDLSNISFVRGKTGWIVLDPLISAETAAAALELINTELVKKGTIPKALPVSVVIYSHSHTDHYGGVRGLFPNGNPPTGVKIIAPEGFTEHAVSENVIAGNAMSRRAVYMYGAALPRNVFGAVNGGLGQTNSTGTGTLILPNTIIAKTTNPAKPLTFDGVRMEFQMTPGSEAPAEMNTYFPATKAMWMAENSTNTMHNILTLRGAQVRDALKWAGYLSDTIDRYGPRTLVKFQSHHWPQWNQDNKDDKIVKYWKLHRDMYKYIHDQSVNLMNKGYTGEEISEMIKLPKTLDQFWPNRGYYGTLRHNSRAVYQRYMGWYNGNPSNLNNLPPVNAGIKYVEYMGGEAAVLAKAKADFDKGEYRWVAEALKHVVFANDKNREARDLLADTLEQLGYQAESGPWRNVYLQGALELRNFVPKNLPGFSTASPDIIRAMPPEMLFDYFAVRLDAQKADGLTLLLNVVFTDLKDTAVSNKTGGKRYGLTVENSVLNHGKPMKDPKVTVTLTKTVMDQIQLGEITVDEALNQNLITLSGSDTSQFKTFLGLLETFPFWFNIVTP